MQQTRKHRGVEGTVKTKEKRCISFVVMRIGHRWSNSGMLTRERFVTRVAKVDYLVLEWEDFRSNSWINGTPVGNLKCLHNRKTLVRCESTRRIIIVRKNVPLAHEFAYRNAMLVRIFLTEWIENQPEEYS